MKKVIVISYFYPPCSLTAGSRPASWARYLYDFGYYPIVITRNWDLPIASPRDMSKPSGREESIKEDEKGKVIFMPFKGTMRDRLYAKYGDEKYGLLRKGLTFAELVMQNLSLKYIPFYNIYKKADELISKDSEIKRVVITANPFISFYIGYALKKKYPHIEWIADYRDDWNTTELVKTRSKLEQFIHRIESASEKKWVGTAKLITTVSPYYAEKISAFVRRPGKVLLNGYSEDDKRNVKPTQKSDEFVITYNGTLYPSQKIEVFLEGFKRIMIKYAGRIRFKLNFPGLDFDKSQGSRVRKAMQGHEDVMVISDRIPRQQVFDMQNESHAYLMAAHDGLKGIPSSKIYEYLNFDKPVILCPDDGDIIRDTLTDTGLGVICNNVEEVETKVGMMVEDVIKYGSIKLDWHPEKTENYSRRNQAKVLAEILNTI